MNYKARRKAESHSFTELRTKSGGFRGRDDGKMGMGADGKMSQKLKAGSQKEEGNGKMGKG
mgnify:CR=1 FL=1